MTSKERARQAVKQHLDEQAALLQHLLRNVENKRQAIDTADVTWATAGDAVQAVNGLLEVAAQHEYNTTEDELVVRARVLAAALAEFEPITVRRTPAGRVITIAAGSR